MPIVEAVVEAQLKVVIHIPAAGTRVLESVPVSGSVFAVRSDNGQLDPKITVTRANSVWVTFGVGGSSVKATMTGLLTWQCTGRVPDSTPSGQPLVISVVAQAGIQNRYMPPGEDQDVGTAQAQVSVLFEVPLPELTVQFTSPVTADKLPYLFRISGTARDSASKITGVQYKIDNGAFANVDNPKGDWSEWSKTIPLQDGSFQLTVEATGKQKASVTNTIII